MKSAKQKDKARRSGGHLTKGDLFDDLGFSAEETLEAKIKSDIWQALMKQIEREGFTQAQLVAMLKCHQPEVSHLLRGKISRFSITKLIQFAGRLDLDASVKVKALRPKKIVPTLRASEASLGRRKRETVAA